MTKRDWFGVGVRLIALWVFVGGLEEVRSMIMIQMNWVGGSFRPGPNDPFLYVFHALWSFAVAIVLFTGARQLTALAYRRNMGVVCANCGYDLTGSTDRCPECGAVPMRAAPMAVPRQK